MSSWLLGFVGFIYLAVAFDYFRQHDYGMCLSFIAYALANLGFIITNVQKTPYTA